MFLLVDRQRKLTMTVISLAKQKAINKKLKEEADSEALEGPSDGAPLASVQKATHLLSDSLGPAAEDAAEDKIEAKTMGPSHGTDLVESGVQANMVNGEASVTKSAPTARISAVFVPDADDPESTVPYTLIPQTCCGSK